jgi:hypothetical protein
VLTAFRESGGQAARNASGEFVDLPVARRAAAIGAGHEGAFTTYYGDCAEEKFRAVIQQHSDAVSLCVTVMPTAVSPGASLPECCASTACRNAN